MPSVEATASVPASAGSSGPGTTLIDWGLIWDALPVGFPHYPGARPANTGGGPASAILDLPADGRTASTWYQAALKAAGFEVTAATGPREDGSFDITANRGGDDCQAEISLAPLAATATATIYLAAACPFV
jgi:hypothetical protein